MLKIYNKDANISKALIYATFVNYVLLLTWIVIFKVNRDWMPEVKAYLESIPMRERIGKGVIPGYSIYLELKSHGFSFTSDHFLNIIAFIPFGILLPFIYKKRKYLYTMLTVICSTVFYEIFQLFTCIGYYDSSDLLTNTLGGFLGLLAYKYLFGKLSGRAINITAISLTGIATPISVFAVYNTILHFNYYL